MVRPNDGRLVGLKKALGRFEVTNVGVVDCCGFVGFTVGTNEETDDGRPVP